MAPDQNQRVHTTDARIVRVVGFRLSHLGLLLYALARLPIALIGRLRRP